MKELVVLKSYPKGLSVHLDPEIPFDQLLAELTKKFSDTRSFLGKARLAISFEGRELSQREELDMLEIVRNNSDLEIPYLVGHDSITNDAFEKAFENGQVFDSAKGRFFKGNLENGEVLESNSSVIIIGNVGEDCRVISARNIIVLGELNGSAYAGANGKAGAFVAALDMAPRKIKIGDYIYETKEKKSLFGRGKKKGGEKIAYVEDGKINLYEFTKEMLQNF